MNIRGIRQTPAAAGEKQKRNQQRQKEQVFHPHYMARSTVFASKNTGFWEMPWRPRRGGYQGPGRKGRRTGTISAQSVEAIYSGRILAFFK
jgi:hypothetical protein